MMRRDSSKRITLTESGSNTLQQLELFALLNLGLVQSLVSGALSPGEALEQFYHADNCLFVKKYLHNRTANAIMSHGVQLPDLFDVLPAEEAQREFYHELETIRTLCLQLLVKQRSLMATVPTAN